MPCPSALLRCVALAIFALTLNACASAARPQSDSPPRDASPGDASRSGEARDNVSLNDNPVTPSEIVRAFYERLHARRFQEALMLSVYRSAVENLNADEAAELRLEFEAMAAGVPARIDITGEQTSNGSSTVFIKLQNEKTGKIEVQPVTLMTVEGRWIIGDRETAEAIGKFGKNYLLELRIQTHHAEAQAMMNRIVRAQLVHSLRHGGRVADMNTLVAEKLLPNDVLGSDSTGYRYRIDISADGKTFTARAEPSRYDRTGRLSFSADAQGVRSDDAGGKAINARAVGR